MCHDENERVPNEAPIGDDVANTPTAICIPVVLLEDHFEQLQWLPTAVDESAADQFESFAQVSGVLVRVISIPLILPAADELRVSDGDLDRVIAEPLRVQLRLPPAE